MALPTVRDGCEGLGTGSGGMTAPAVHEQLEEELSGQGRAQEVPVLRSVKRWLNRWVEDGVLALGGKVRIEGVSQPLATYCTPSHARARVRGATSGCPLSVALSDPLVRQEIATDKPSDTEEACPLPPVDPPSTESNGQAPAPSDSVSVAISSHSNESHRATDNGQPEVSLRARARGRASREGQPQPLQVGETLHSLADAIRLKPPLVALFVHL
jgi:hypothetical protein